jgi:hypothetical protein
MEFMPDIRYVKGTDNVVADALSRRVDLAAVQLQSGLSSNLLVRVAASYASDSAVTDMLASGVLHEEGRLMYTDKNMLYIPPGEIQTEVVRECHATPFHGHLRTKKTKDFLLRYCWWPGLQKDVTAFCVACPTCQRTKGTSRAPMDLLQPLSIPTVAWESVSMDLITDLPPSNGFDAITVFVDRLTKLIVCVPCIKTVTAPQLAELFIDNAAHHGPAILSSMMNCISINLM